jgi:hypothetical protein
LGFPFRTKEQLVQVHPLHQREFEPLSISTRPFTYPRKNIIGIEQASVTSFNFIDSPAKFYIPRACGIYIGRTIKARYQFSGKVGSLGIRQGKSLFLY